MSAIILLILTTLAAVSPVCGACGAGVVATAMDLALVLHTYECKLRVDGRITTTQVKASDAGQAKKLAQQQFPKATVLGVKRLD
ncbi:MAG: hypothetical protein EBR28_04800 [Planctomycetia bacterium]|nr:hypothetical protein [Planctomycetia bacterium]